jgi:hypothetical protein
MPNLSEPCLHYRCGECHDFACEDHCHIGQEFDWTTRTWVDDEPEEADA